MQTSEFVKEQLESLDFDTILELGSGEGRMTKVLLENFAISKYVTCDINEELNTALQIKLYGSHLNLLNFNCDYLKLRVGYTKYDIVLATHVIENTDFKNEYRKELLDKMCNESKKYVIHTCVEDPFYLDYWFKQKKDYTITGLNIDEVRKLIIAERI